VDLDVGKGSRRGRDMCEPIGKWVNPTHEGATGRRGKKILLKEESCVRPASGMVDSRVS
jgi:hypothetical protein